MFARKGAHQNELAIPTAAAEDPNGFEMLRIWIAGGQEHAVTRGGQFDDAGSWGIILADLAQHLADSFAQDTGQSRDAALDRIRTVFVDEMK